MSKVEILDEHRPHFVIDTPDENVHVLPVSFIDDVINGKRDFTDADDHKILLRALLKDWRDFIMEVSDE